LEKLQKRKNCKRGKIAKDQTEVIQDKKRSHVFKRKNPER
jgi:hypothetical protein